MLARTEKTKAFWVLIGIVFGFFLLRLPSLIEPYWYGDEGIYQVIGNALNHGRLLYTGIWDNKPPLLYVLYAIFSANQFWVRVASLVFGVCAVISFYALAKSLFGKQEKAQFIPTAIFAFLFGIPLLEGNIANAENFMLFPIILAGVLVYNSTKLKTDATSKLSFSIFQLSTLNFQLVFAGFLLSLAFLFKVVAVFDFAAFTLFLIFTKTDQKNWLYKNIHKAIPLIFGFSIPVLLTSIFFILHGTFADFISATLGQNVGYVEYGNKFIFPQGLLFLKFFLLFLATTYLFIKRKVLSPAALFLGLWFSFSLFNTFFSQRPYTHYLLVLLPSFCLIIGIFFLSNIRHAYKKTIALLLLITILLVFKNFTLYQKTIDYYQNYISFIFNKKSVTQYQTFFDQNIPTTYAIVSFLKLHIKPNDAIFVWGNTPGVYALTNTLPPGRYIVVYHIRSSEDALLETQKTLLLQQPRYIIQTSKTPIPFSIGNYKEQFTIYGTHIYERTF